MNLKFLKTVIKKLLIRFVFFIVFIFILLLGRNFWLPMVGKTLIRDDMPAKGADAIVLLTGDFRHRPVEAVRLYNEKYAPKIMIAPEEGNILVEMGLIQPRIKIALKQLHLLGVNEKDIEVYRDREVTSTIEEAAALKAYLEKANPTAKRLILVSSWYHTSRVGWTFEKVFSGSGIIIEVTPVTSQREAYKIWWESENDFLAVFNEYLKWVYYLMSFSSGRF